MEQDKNILDLLEKMERNSARQLMYARLMCLFSVIAAVCCICIFWKLNSLLPQLQNFALQAEAVLTNLETATAQLASVDLNGMVAGITDLVTASQAGVEEAISKLNELDIDVLNKTISDLSVVVERLARIASIFG